MSQTVPAKIQATTWLDAKTYDALAALAEQNERSIAAELRLAIRAYLAKAA
jgi:hypothetical protein